MKDLGIDEHNKVEESLKREEDPSENTKHMSRFVTTESANADDNRKEVCNEERGRIRECPVHDSTALLACIL